MIEVKNLSCKYRTGADYAIRNASFEIQSNGITAIVGTSGVGKSTLLALLSGVYTADDEIIDRFEGDIALDGQKPQQLRGPRIVSWVPQDAALLDHLTIMKNVLLPIVVTDRDVSDDRDWESECLRILRKLGLGERGNARPRQLSGGMRTRVSIARALITQPKYLFLDEPFISLDVANRWNMYVVLGDERRVGRLCTMIATHDIPEAMLLADRILLVGYGENGTTVDIFQNSPLDLHLIGLEAALTEARLRAQEIERQIYERAS